MLLAGVALAAAPAAFAQEVESEAEAEQAEHAEHGEEHAEGLAFRHGVSLFVGAATHTEVNDTGVAVGLSYAYVLSPRWAVGVKLEYASSELERDLVGLLGVAFEPVHRLEFAAGIGVEKVDKDVIEHGEEHTERETEALLRLGFAYAFPLSARTYLLPEFNADIAGGRVTYVYGLTFTVGL